MAATIPIHFTATVEDDATVKASTTVHLLIDPAQTVTQLLAALSSWLGALDGISGGVIVRYAIGIQPSLVLTVKTTPDPTAEVQECASLDFKQAGTQQHYGNIIPAFLESLEVSEKPNLTDPLVTAYTGLLTTAVLGGFYTGLGNAQLTAIDYAFLPTRKHRRQQRAVSFVKA